MKYFDSTKVLEVFERILLAKQYPNELSQLFILGLPRSGTTLVYQYIVHRLQVSYFTNAVGKYHLSPCLVSWVERSLFGAYQSDFKSDHGAVKGRAAPREAGSFWGRLLGFEDYLSIQDVTDRDAMHLQKTVACVQTLFGGQPFVNKNVKHMLRIEVLAHLFPSSCFLVVERHLRDVALSLLRARNRRDRNPDEWWSVRPPNYATIKNLPLAEQVANQVLELRARMGADLRKLPLDRVLSVDYSTFCTNPEHLTDRLVPRLKVKGYRNGPVRQFKEQTNGARSWQEEELLKILGSLEPRYRQDGCVENLIT